MLKGDKAKGIICKSMPRYWHDKYSISSLEEKEQEFQWNIVADRKPYFMRYIYPALMKQYNRYVKNTNRNALREFQMTVPELKEIPEDELTDRQKEFLYFFHRSLPVGISDCVMNKICRRFEEEFDGHIRKHNEKVDFDYTIMKSDAEYTSKQFYKIKSLFKDYNKKLQGLKVFADYERLDKTDVNIEISTLNEELRKECELICPNADSLCNMILDICYTRNSTKKFAWNMCGETIIKNLLHNSGGTISFPSEDPDGDVSYLGNTYSVRTITIGEKE